MRDNRFGLPDDEVRRLLEEIKPGESTAVFDRFPTRSAISAPLPGTDELALGREWLEQHGLSSPYGRLVEPDDGVTTRVDGRPAVSFASYDYLGLGRDPRLVRAAADAVERWGSSSFASRLMSGERPVHRTLEADLADLHGAESALVFVSGHATNVTVLGTILAGGGVLIHDDRIHNSVLQGAVLARARTTAFPHNDWEAAGKLLARLGAVEGMVLIVIEGLYSMDGDVPDLERFVEIARRHGARLMVDEAHSVGVLGPAGRGIGELYDIDGDAVDLWMGTLSKALGGCGGYIAGSRELIDYLKFRAPGFVFSVGMPPPMAAISLEALKILRSEPERVRRLQSLGAHALQTARRLGLDTGRAEGHAVLPVLVGNSGRTVRLSHDLLDAGFDIPPAIPPAVEDRAARLRLFISAAHDEKQLDAALERVAGLLRSSARG